MPERVRNGSHTAVARGALNFLGKPFTAERLTAHRHYRSALPADRAPHQDEIDAAARRRPAAPQEHEYRWLTTG